MCFFPMVCVFDCTSILVIIVYMYILCICLYINCCNRTIIFISSLRSNGLLFTVYFIFCWYILPSLQSHKTIKQRITMWRSGNIDESISASIVPHFPNSVQFPLYITLKPFIKLSLTHWWPVSTTTTTIPIFSTVLAPWF